MSDKVAAATRDAPQDPLGDHRGTRPSPNREASPHCDWVPASMTTRTAAPRLRISEAKPEDKEMDSIPLLILAIAMILAMNIVASPSPTDRRSHN
jgi:hypothetical protein